MEAFEIDINHGETIVRLTILQENDCFKIISGGRLLGAIKQEGIDWFLVEPDESSAEQRSSDAGKSLEIDQIILGAAEVNQIAGEIENHLR